MRCVPAWRSRTGKIYHEEEQGKVCPEQAEQDVDQGFFPLAFPQSRRIPEKLDEQPEQPECTEPQADILSQLCACQRCGRMQAQYTHQQYGKGYEKGMHIHELPVDQAKPRQLPRPVEIAGKTGMDQGQEQE